jgi:hypothetical protein
MEYQDEDEVKRVDPVSGEENKSTGSSRTSNREAILLRKQRDAVVSSLNVPIKDFLSTSNLLSVFLLVVISASIAIGFLEVSAAKDGTLSNTKF